MIGIGTRYSDFTTASKTAFQNPDVRFININVAEFDADKHAALARRRRRARDARATRRAARRLLGGRRATAAGPRSWTREWDDEVDAALHAATTAAARRQGEVIGAVNDARRPRDVVVCAAGSHARRPAQALAHARPEGLPPRVRLLVHGLRDRRRPGRQDGRARARGLRDRRRRLVPDAARPSS